MFANLMKVITGVIAAERKAFDEDPAKDIVAEERREKLAHAKHVKETRVNPDHFEFQIQWTGGRFTKVRNGLFDVSERLFYKQMGERKDAWLKINIVPGSVCKADPANGGFVSA